MQFTDLPQNTSGVLYQNDSPTPLLVTVQVAGSFSTRARAHPVIFNSTANPADQAVVGPLSTGSRTYLILRDRASKSTPRTAAKSDSMCY